MTPYVLIHGFTGAPSSWDIVRVALHNATPVLLPTLHGHGPQGDLGEPRTLTEEVDRLAAEIVLALGTGSVLGGYSLGSRIGLGLLVRHPGLFRGAVLVGCRPALDSEDAIRTRAAQDEERAERIERAGLAAFVDSWERLPHFALQHGLPGPVQAQERERRMSHTAVGLARSLRLHGLAQMPWGREALAAIRTPVTFVVGGAEDPGFQAFGEDLAATIPGARLVRADGAGHNVLLERPAVVARELEEL